MYPPP